MSRLYGGCRRVICPPRNVTITASGSHLAGSPYCTKPLFANACFSPSIQALWKGSRSPRRISSPFRLKLLSTTAAGVDKARAPTSHPRLYSPPQTGFISKLPVSWIPYAELMRLDKPAGTYYLFSPCLFSTLLAAQMALPPSSPLQILHTTFLFFSGALIMRGAGCTINDLWDRDLDPLVERTRLRPIARKAINPQQAIIFLGGQLLAGLAILLQFQSQCFFYAAPSLLLVATYPLAKRVTSYPQFVLGLTFSWGAIVGFPAMGVDLISDPHALMAATALYSSCVAWTVNYDMIYAHMDIKDDVKAGIRSIARAHEHNTKAVLSGLSVVQIGLLAAAGHFSGAGPAFFAISCLGGATTLASMIWRVRLKDPVNCWWWFVNGCWITGGTISGGLLVDFLLRRRTQEEGIVADPALQSS